MEPAAKTHLLFAGNKGNWEEDDILRVVSVRWRMYPRPLKLASNQYSLSGGGFPVTRSRKSVFRLLNQENKGLWPRRRCVSKQCLFRRGEIRAPCCSVPLLTMFALPCTTYTRGTQYTDQTERLRRKKKKTTRGKLETASCYKSAARSSAIS